MSTISNAGAIRHGSWDSGFCYNAHDVVLGNDGNLYSAAIPSAGIDPAGDDGSRWRLLATAGGVTCTVFTLRYAGANDVVLTRGIGGGSPAQEAGLRSNNPDNVLFLQNQSANGFSTLTMRDAGGYEKMALGYGNASALGAFASQAYLEISDAMMGNNGVAPRFVLRQTTRYSDLGCSYYFYDRLSFETDGTVKFWRRDSSNANGGCEVMTLSKDSPVVTLGGTGIDGASNYGELRGADANHALVLRDMARGINAISVYEYGGTLAQNRGFLVFTGGLRGDQVKRLHVADDGIAQMAPAAAPSDASLFAGSVCLWLDESGHNLKVKVKYSGGTVKTGTVALS